MMYSEEDHIARWNAADWTRDFEGLPDIDAIKAAMFPVAVTSLSLPNGKIAGPALLRGPQRLHLQ